MFASLTVLMVLQVIVWLVIGAGVVFSLVRPRGDALPRRRRRRGRGGPDDDNRVSERHFY